MPGRPREQSAQLGCRRRHRRCPRCRRASLSKPTPHLKQLVPYHLLVAVLADEERGEQSFEGVNRPSAAACTEGRAEGKRGGMPPDRLLTIHQ